MKKITALALCALLPALTSFKAEAMLCRAAQKAGQAVLTIKKSDTPIKDGAKLATKAYFGTAAVGYGAGVGLGLAGMLASDLVGGHAVEVRPSGERMICSQFYRTRRFALALRKGSLIMAVAPFKEVQYAGTAFYNAVQDAKRFYDDERRLPKQ